MFVYSGLHYAFGPADIEEAFASSAFSKGDVLMYDSTSSLSRADLRLTSGADLAGVAAADSLQSFRRQIPFFKAGPDTVYWSVITPGSNVTAGLELDLVDDNGDITDVGRTLTALSSNSVRVVVERPIARVNQDSGVSRVLVRLIRHSGAVEHT